MCGGYNSFSELINQMFYDAFYFIVVVSMFASMIGTLGCGARLKSRLKWLVVMIVSFSIFFYA